MRGRSQVFRYARVAWAPLLMVASVALLPTFGWRASAQVAQPATTSAYSGTVVDATDAPIPGAHLQVRCPPAPAFPVVSARDGSFGFECVASAGVGQPAEVQVSAPGFRMLRASVAAGTPAALKLAIDEVLAQATVTATRSPLPLGDTAKTVSGLSGDEIRNYPAPTLDDALRQHAGFELFRRASSRAANPTSQGISLRGLGSTAASRTLVLSEGAPLNDPFGGWVHWNELPESVIQSVTLVSGGGSDLYGSSAMAGVIDVIPAAPVTSLFDVSAAGGSQYTSDLDGRVDHRLRFADALLAMASLRTAGYIVTAPQFAGPIDIPANVNSFVTHAELGRRSFNSKNFFLMSNVLDEARSNGTPLQTNATRLWRYLGGYNTPADLPFELRTRVFGSEEGYRQSFSAITATRNGEALTRLQNVRTQELGATMDASLPVRRHFVVTAGGDTRDLRATDLETPIAGGLPNGFQNITARQRFTGAFVEAFGQFGKWSFAAAVRVDAAQNLAVRQWVRSSSAQTITTPADRTEWIPSPRVGVTRQLGMRAEVYGSAFRAFRTPTMNELYRTGQVGQEITLASASLRSERATGYETGLKLHDSSARWTASAVWFWTEINRPVSAVLVSQTSTTITNQRANLGQIQSSGLEVNATVPLRTHFSFAARYQLADARVTNFSANPSFVGNRIPQVPRHSAAAQLHFSASRATALLALRSSSHAFDDAANQFKLNRFATLEASGQYELSRRFSLNALVQNLTNQRPEVARTPVLTLGSGIYAQAGIRLRLGPAEAKGGSTP